MSGKGGGGDVEPSNGIANWFLILTLLFPSPGISVYITYIQKYLYLMNLWLFAYCLKSAWFLPFLILRNFKLDIILSLRGTKLFAYTSAEAIKYFENILFYCNLNFKNNSKVYSVIQRCPDVSGYFKLIWDWSFADLDIETTKHWLTLGGIQNISPAFKELIKFFGKNYIIFVSYWSIISFK